LWSAGWSDTIAAMKSRGAWGCFLTFAFTASSVGCSSSSTQVDAGSPADAALPDAGTDHMADAFVPGADARKDTTPGGAPDVQALCPGIDPWGYDRPFEAGSAPLPDGVDLVVASGQPTMMLSTPPICLF
jgi:hypothetical protein